MLLRAPSDHAKMHPAHAASGMGYALPRGPFWFDLLALLIVSGFFVFIIWGMTAISAPLENLEKHVISLDPDNLPEYALRTTMRMLVAMAVAFLFTLVYATLAAKSAKAGQILIPMLDVLQSVPVLGYISFTVTGFIALFPSSMLGVECAAIFAIFTAQAWNMIFSLYQSLRTLPRDMHEAAFVYKLTGWQKFWCVELPFAMPGLVWNMMISMSGAWFFVVASEAITVGNTTVMLPGIGAYIALAIKTSNLQAIYYAILAMGVVILLYDQFLFRPLVAWSDKFRYEMTAKEEAPSSWIYTLFGKSRLAHMLFTPVRLLFKGIAGLPLFAFRSEKPQQFFSPKEARLFDVLWYTILAVLGSVALFYVAAFLRTGVAWSEVIHVLTCAGLTLLRIMVLILLASILWVPVGVAIGLNPRAARIVQPLAQFLAAFPANLLFPLAVVAISRYSLDPDIWLSPLMILGTQWYILFNVVAGASSFPNDLREVSRSLSIRGLLWWRRVILPGIFPYYLTGAIGAYGGAWNASIVAEVVSWGDKAYEAKGLGSYIADMTAKGDLVHVGLGIGVMAITVVLVNKLFWRPLYEMAERKLRFD